MTQNRAEKLKGITERRSIGLTDFEMRADGNTLKFSGYASLFNVGYEMYGGPDKGGWIEYVDPDAFKRTLANKPDVVLNMNHGDAGTGLPIARTTSGTLNLTTDKKGLLPSSELDLRDPDVQALQVKVDRGDVNQMSFAFRTIRQEWNDEESERRLLELNLDRGDVSIVTNGANPKTSVQLRGWAEAVAALTHVDVDEVVAEMRSMKDEVSVCSACGATMSADSMSCVDCGADNDIFASLLSAQTTLGKLIANARPEAERESDVKTKTTSLAAARRLILLDA